MMELRLVEVGGWRIAVRVWGQGADALLVHGITTWGFVWEPVARLLGAAYRLVVPDLLGCGDSDKPPRADLSPRAQARLLVGVLDHLGLERAHWVGHDVGGAVAQIAAVEARSRVRSLGLVNTVGYDYWPVQPISLLRVPVIRQIALGAFDAGAFHLVLRRAFYRKDRLTPELMAHFQRPLSTPEGRRGFLQFARSLDPAQLLRVAKEFPDLDLPSLIVRGDADPYLSPRISERLAREIPGARLERLARAGHFLQLEEPSWLAERLDRFWRGTDG